MSAEEIIAAHPLDWGDFQQGYDMTTYNSPLFMALYAYWVSTGEMPYGTAKARDGDPDQWIADKLEGYL